MSDPTGDMPLPWHGTDVMAATDGFCLSGNPDAVFAGIAIDSRTMATDDLFIAIRGDVHDGHQFIETVVDAGGRGVVIEAREAHRFPLDKWSAAGVLCIGVDNTTRALGRLGSAHCRRSEATVVAITGSNGKTSTREMTVSILAPHWPTLAPVSNFNNEIGVPLTLLRLCPEHRWAVIELGMNHAGEIARLTAMCRPRIGVITNIGPAHLEGLGSIDRVMAAKGELLDEMAADAHAVLNGDDPRTRRLGGGAAQSVLFFGRSESTPVRAENPTETGGDTAFDLILPSGRVRVRLATPGRFMVANALAAAAVGHLAGLGPEAIRDGLERFRPVRGRLNIVRAPIGVHVIDDTYNANPASMVAAAETLSRLSRGGRSVLVAGDMKELGTASETLHRDTGRRCARLGLTRLYVTGDFAGAFADGAAAGGMPADAIVCGEKPDIASDLIGWLEPGDWVAVKGSRAMKMEDIVRVLLNEPGDETTE